MAKQPASSLSFEATIGGLKTVMEKASTYGQPTPGRLELTLFIDQPKQPAAPQEWNDYRTGKMVSRPKTADEQPVFRYIASPKKGATLEEQEAAKHKGLEKAQAAWDVAHAKYLRQVEATRDLTLRYAQLVGISAVFGHSPLRVAITPQQELLAGFGVDMLIAGATSEEDEE